MYGEWRLPRCAGILTTPTLRPDGTILAKPGYDEKTQLFLADPPAVEIPEAPAKEDAIAALRFLSALLFEFPYADKYSRAVHLSAILSAVGRGGFMSAPMHVTRSHESGSGKSYFNDILSGIATGRLCPVIAAGKTEEETEKRLGAALIRGQSVISIDNVNGELAGDFLCQAVERPFLYVRPLGRSELCLIEPRSTLFLATGNNLILSGDLTRRALIATLDPAVPDPEDRTFTREPAKDVVAERGKYIAAALTILRSYIAAGRPDKPNRLGSFETWSDTVRGALVWLGEGDPVETLKTARNEDPRRVALRDILHTWKDAAGTGVASERTTAKLIEMAEGKIELRDALLAVAGYSGRIESKALGYWLRNNHGKIIDGMRLTNDGKLSRPRWWIDFAG
jgi:putative DNA primase/helicase